MRLTRVKVLLAQLKVLKKAQIQQKRFKIHRLKIKILQAAQPKPAQQVKINHHQ